MGHPQILMNQFKNKRPTKRQQLQMMEYPGRKSGAVHGSHISDLAEMRAAILLCTQCRSRFNPKSYCYLATRELYVEGS